MRRAIYLSLMCLSLLLLFYAYKMKQERLEVEQLLWVEFDAALSSLIRTLHLAEAATDQPGTGAQAALLAAYEHSLILRRLSPVADQLLLWRGVRSEPLAGYLFSLTGGVASVCDEARLQGTPDKEWAGEIRRRLESIHDALNIDTVTSLSRRDLQQKIDALFGADPTLAYFTVTALPPPACW